ncbi:hypothetical protein [Pelagibius marinus]|uniref:hypothetical protein n=1 Tax=Pelagibius marinus TaxID=2762760 RepID=UPI0018728D4F|nr:hypothetical protein [Pelagibius marinus]
MPAISGHEFGRVRLRRAWILVLLVTAAGGTGTAAAQDASYFSPTYAASDGSPYSSVYARTFGAGGPPPPASRAAAPPPETAPLVTGAGRPLPATPAVPADSGPDGSVVYVIEDGRLLSYRAEDYARGRGAFAGAAVPPAVTGSAAATPPADLSSITSRLYGASPLDTGAGPAAPSRPGAPIQLVPPRKPAALEN